MDTKHALKGILLNLAQFVVVVAVVVVVVVVAAVADVVAVLGVVEDVVEVADWDQATKKSQINDFHKSKRILSIARKNMPQWYCRPDSEGIRQEAQLGQVMLMILLWEKNKVLVVEETHTFMHKCMDSVLFGAA